MIYLPVDDAAVAGAACAVTGKHFGHLLLGKLGVEPSGEVVLVGAGLVAEGGHVGQIIPNSPSVYRGRVSRLLSYFCRLPPPLPHQLHILLTWQPLAFLGRVFLEPLAGCHVIGAALLTAAAAALLGRYRFVGDGVDVGGELRLLADGTNLVPSVSLDLS